MKKLQNLFVLSCFAAIIIIWGIGCTSDEEKNTASDALNRLERPESNPESRVSDQTRAEFKTRAGAKNVFSKAKEAFEQGDYGLAKELTKKAILEALHTVNNAKDDDTVAQAKQKTMPLLKEMWDVNSRINQVLKSDGSGGEKASGPESGPALASERESGYEPELDTESVPGVTMDNEKTLTMLQEKWAFNSRDRRSHEETVDTGAVAGPEKDSDVSMQPDSEEPELPDDDSEEREGEESRKTCCGGYTEDELYALFYENADQFWDLLWSCSDLENCLK